MGPVKKAMGLFFIALKHGADSSFAISSHESDIFFSTTLKPMRRYLQKKQLQLYFSQK